MVRRRLGLVCAAALLAGCSGTAATGPTSSAGSPVSSLASVSQTAAPASSPAPTTSATAGSTTTIEAATAPVQPSGDPTDVVTGLESPWSIVFVDQTALISERNSGRILELTDGGTREVGTVDGVVHQGEGGLLGLAVNPEHTYLYAYFTSATDNRIVRYPLTGGAGSMALGQQEPIFSGIHKAGNHDGGRLAFGPDGMLYATAGDAGERDDAQDPNSPNGKILRLTPAGQVPADNPIPGNPMWSMGHRNPQGIGWDAQGRMWAAEFGQDTWDELNQITPGANYGWPIVEGIADDPRFVNPVHQWNPDDASPSGIAVVGGTIFIANLKGERLRAVPTADPSQETDYYQQQYGRLRYVTQAPDGSLWILTNNTDGRGDPNDGDDRVLSVRLATG